MGEQYGLRLAVLVQPLGRASTNADNQMFSLGMELVLNHSSLEVEVVQAVVCWIKKVPKCSLQVCLQLYITISFSRNEKKKQLVASSAVWILGKLH